MEQFQCFHYQTQWDQLLEDDTAIALAEWMVL